MERYLVRVKDLHKLCQEAPAGVGYDARAILHFNQNSLVERNIVQKENKIMTVLWIRIRMFLSPPDPLVSGTDPATDPSIIKQK